MTTVACDGRSIAADGMVSGNGMVHHLDFPKVRRLKSGAVVGFSGQPFDAVAMMAYLNGEKDSLDLDEGFEALILHPSGVCECMDGKGRRYVQTTPCATGSGTAFALTMMDAGYPAEKAVSAAIKRDTTSGGIITCLRPERNEAAA